MIRPPPRSTRTDTLFSCTTLFRSDIHADIRSGTRRDAVLFSVGANFSHGLRRSNEDKRASVKTLIEDAEWSQWSDRQIAAACGVSHPFVAAIRAPKAAGRQQANRLRSAGGVESASTPALRATRTAERRVGKEGAR